MGDPKRLSAVLTVVLLLVGATACRFVLFYYQLPYERERVIGIVQLLLTIGGFSIMLKTNSEAHDPPRMLYFFVSCGFCLIGAWTIFELQHLRELYELEQLHGLQ